MLTMTLQQIAALLQNKTEYSLLSDINSDINALRSFLFDFDFDFYDVSKKEEFLNKWLYHFYMREHAFETVAMFKMKVHDFFVTNMPQFNKAFNFYSGEFELDESVNYTEKYDFNREMKNNENYSGNGQNNLNITNNSNNTSNEVESGSTRTNNNVEEKNAFSDTPEGRLSNVEELSYLSEYRNISNITENEIQHGKKLEGRQYTNDNSKQNAEFSENNQRKNDTNEKQTYQKTVKGNTGARSIIYDFSEFIHNMRSAEYYFYELSDKELFLHTWNL